MGSLCLCVFFLTYVYGEPIFYSTGVSTDVHVEFIQPHLASVCLRLSREQNPKLSNGHRSQNVTSACATSTLQVFNSIKAPHVICKRAQRI